MEHVVCDFHAPGYNSPLDLAPRLGKDLRPKYFMGQPIMDHVGSTAVRKVLSRENNSSFSRRQNTLEDRFIYVSAGDYGNCAFSSESLWCFNDWCDYDRA